MLPFANQGGGDEYFSVGITDEIINQLAQVESLKVISRTSVLALRGSKLTLPQIAETLGVRHIVEGSVRRQGTRVRVTAELIEAASDAHLWAGSFEGNLADSFRVQEEIARKVSGQLMNSIRGHAADGGGRHGHAERGVRRGAPRPPPARAPIARRGRTARSPRSARRSRSTRGTPRATPACRAPMRCTWSTDSPAGSIHYVATVRALALADRAVELDSQSAEAYLALSDALLISLAPEGEVVDALRQARQRMPGSVSVSMTTAHALEHMAKWPAALQQARRALELDPLSTGVRHSAITVALGARDYDFALSEARRAREFDTTDQVGLVLEAYALLLKGDPESCVALPLGPWAATRAMCLHEAGKTQEAKAVGDSLAAQLDAGRYLTIHQFADMAAYRAWVGDAAGHSPGWRRAHGSPPCSTSGTSIRGSSTA